MAWSIPANAVSGTQIPAATTNAILADLTIIGQAAQSYTPTTTGITLGNGTISARVNQVNKWVDFQIIFTFGSTSAITAVPTFTLPTVGQGAGWTTTDCSANHAGARYPIAAIATTSSVLTIQTWPATAGNAWINLSSTVPFTWATNDVLIINGRYEAA